MLTLSRTRQLAKADGRDKLLALLQYAAMFAAAGVPGRALKVQRNLGAARKPFRVLKARARVCARLRRRVRAPRPACADSPPRDQPLEALLPLLTSPSGRLTPQNLANKARVRRARARAQRACSRSAQLKALSFAAFFGFDHVVWAGGAGLVEDKALLERAQELSFYGWWLGSLCGLALDLAELRRLRASRRALRAAQRSAEAEERAGGGKALGGEAAAERARGAAQAAAARADALARAAEEQRAKLISVAGLATQAALAASLLKLLPTGPKATGVLGVVTSAIAVYQLLPPLPPPAAKPKKE